MFFIFFRQNQFENAAKNNKIPVDPKVHDKEMYPLKLSQVVPKQEQMRKLRKFQLESKGLIWIPMTQNMIGTWLLGLPNI